MYYQFPKSILYFSSALQIFKSSKNEFYCIDLPDKTHPSYIKGTYHDKIRSQAKLEKKFTTLSSAQENSHKFMTQFDFLNSMSNQSYHTLTQEQLKFIQEKQFSSKSFLMEIIDSNNDNVISFSEQVVMAVFIDMKYDKIRNIFKDCSSTNQKDMIEHLWTKVLASRVVKNVSTSPLDARQTHVTHAELRQNQDHIIQCIITKQGKLDAVILEKIYNLIMKDVFQFDFQVNDDYTTETISQQTFAKIILKQMPLKDRQKQIERLRKLKVDQTERIKIDDFLGFCQFAEQSGHFKELLQNEQKKVVTLEEFKKLQKEQMQKRKYKYKMNDHMINVLFRVLDIDSNDELDLQEYNLITSRDSIGIEDASYSGMIGYIRDKFNNKL